MKQLIFNTFTITMMMVTVLSTVFTPADMVIDADKTGAIEPLKRWACYYLNQGVVVATKHFSDQTQCPEIIAVVGHELSQDILKSSLKIIGPVRS